jgi:hypothetical protein
MEAKAEGCEVVTYNDGVSGSAASPIFMCGNVRKMAEQSLIMIHSATGGDDSEALQKINDGLMQTYMTLTGASKKTVLDWMSKDTWFNAKEALEMGLCTEIYKPGEVEKAENYMSLGRQILAKAGKMPVFKAQTENEMTEQEKERLAEYDQLKEKADKADALQTELDQIKADAETALLAEANTLVENAIEAGVYTEAEKAEAIVVAKANTKLFAASTERFVAAKKPQYVASFNASAKKDAMANNLFEGKTYREIEASAGGSAFLKTLKTANPEGFKALWATSYQTEAPIN